MAVCNYLGMANVQRGWVSIRRPPLFTLPLPSLTPNYRPMISTGDVLIYKIPVLKEPRHCGGRRTNNKDSDTVKWKMYRINNNYLRSPEKGGTQPLRISRTLPATPPPLPPVQIKAERNK